MYTYLASRFQHSIRTLGHHIPHHTPRRSHGSASLLNTIFQCLIRHQKNDLGHLFLLSSCPKILSAQQILSSTDNTNVKRVRTSSARQTCDSSPRNTTSRLFIPANSTRMDSTSWTQQFQIQSPPTSILPTQP